MHGSVTILLVEYSLTWINAKFAKTWILRQRDVKKNQRFFFPWAIIYIENFTELYNFRIVILLYFFDFMGVYCLHARYIQNLKRKNK